MNGKDVGTYDKDEFIFNLSSLVIEPRAVWGG